MTTDLSAITLPHPGPCTPTAWPNFLMMGNDDDSYCASLLRHHNTNRHPGWLGHERRTDALGRTWTRIVFYTQSDTGLGDLIEVPEHSS